MTVTGAAITVIIECAKFVVPVLLLIYAIGYARKSNEIKRIGNSILIACSVIIVFVFLLVGAGSLSDESARRNEIKQSPLLALINERFPDQLEYSHRNYQNRGEDDIRMTYYFDLHKGDDNLPKDLTECINEVLAKSQNTKNTDIVCYSKGSGYWTLRFILSNYIVDAENDKADRFDHIVRMDINLSDKNMVGSDKGFYNNSEIYKNVPGIMALTVQNDNDYIYAYKNDWMKYYPELIQYDYNGTKVIE